MSSESTASSIAEIDLKALLSNLQQIRKQIGDREILAVVKANAYGHGALPIAQYLNQHLSKPPLWAVAFLEEGIALRSGGISGPIILMTGAPLAQVKEIVAHDLCPVIYDAETLQALSRTAMAAQKEIAVHVKIDTGMGRLGILPEKALTFIEAAVKTPGIRLDGILSHFAHPDLADAEFTGGQLHAFQKVIHALEQKGIKIPYRHMANSAAVVGFKDAYLNLIRPGLMLYGYSNIENRKAFRLAPVMRVKARVIALKTMPAGTSISYGRTYFTQQESRIATVSLGYADGYPCSLSNRSEMIAQGQRVPVVGRVCMDMTMVDVTSVPTLKVGDWLTAMGVEGEQSIWADQLAKWADTHPYEILCGFGPRVRRHYIS